MKFKSIIYTLGLTLAAACAVQANAQQVELLGFTVGDRASQIKAWVDLQGKQLTGVTTYSYDMTNGASQTSTSYDLVDGQYISANVDAWSGAYDFFQMKLTFADGKTYVTECVNPDMTEAFYWLGDIPMASYQSGWDSNHPPQVDGSVDPGVKIKLDDVVYYKGVSNHADGYIQYDLSNFTLPDAYEGFTRLVSKVGVQDTNPNGHLTFIFKTDNTQVKSLEMYAKMYDKSRPDVPCVQDVEIVLNGKSTLRIEAASTNNDGYYNWGDHAQMAMARLYLQPRETARKPTPTVKISNSGGQISGSIPLSASLSGASGNIYYRITSGSAYAAIDGANNLVPVWGTKGEVIVEACYYGDRTHTPAADYAIFYVDLVPAVELLGIYNSPQPGVAPRGYVLVDSKGTGIESLIVKVYENARTLKSLTEINLTAKAAAARGGILTIPFDLPANATEDVVIKTAYQYSGGSLIETPYWEKGEYFDYMSDLPASIHTGYGSAPSKDKPFGDSALNKVLELGTGNSAIQYAKGFGFHANGWVETTGDLTPYSRMSLDLGGQAINNIHTSELKFNIQNGATYLRPDTVVNYTSIFTFYGPINNAQKIRINGSYTNDATNAVVAIGAPRLFRIPGVKQSQEIVWESEEGLHAFQPATLPLEAIAASGLKVDYRIVKGSEYASISGSSLIISSFPNEGEIIVEAYQPGDATWAQAPLYSKTYRVVKGLEVARNERVTLDGGTTLNELVIYADRESSGQVDVKEGFVHVNSLVIKYTFIPGEWHFLSFPSSVNIDKISTFNEKGYTFNNPVGSSYFIEQYDTGKRAEKPEASAWTPLETPDVKGMKGYAMGIDNSLGNDPVEIAFTFTNADLDLSTCERPFNVALDMQNVQPGTTQRVTVSPVNVHGNSLTVDVHFNPESLENLPIDYQRVLGETRYTFVGNRQAMRFTLPDQTPARVVFFDKDGKNVVKAVRYVSPMAIDITDLKKGEYNIVVTYGNATRIFPLEL